MQVVVVAAVAVIVAAVATPGLGSVRSASQDEAVRRMLVGVASRAGGFAAWRFDGSVTGADVTRAVRDLAAGWVVEPTEGDPPSGPMRLAWDLDDPPRRAAVGAVSTSGSVLWVVFDAYGRVLETTVSATSPLDGSPTPAPDPPTGLSATPGDATVTLTWNRSPDPDVAAYGVTWNPGAGSSSLSQLACGTVCTMVVTGLTNDVTYTFDVVATDTAGRASSPATTTATPTSPYSPSGGTPDAGFSGDGHATVLTGDTNLSDQVVVDSAGKILITGAATTAGEVDLAVWRFNPDGTLDAGFGSGGVFTWDGGYGEDKGHGLVIDPSGRIMVSGYSMSSDGTTRDAVVLRLTGSGALDTTWGSSGVVRIDNASQNNQGYRMVRDSAGRWVLSGYMGLASSGNDTMIEVIRLTSTGTLDGTFGTGGIATFNVVAATDRWERSHDLVEDTANGRYMIAGWTTGGTSHRVFLLAVRTSDGGLDTTWGSSGVFQYDPGSRSRILTVAARPGGGWLLAGYTGADGGSYWETPDKKISALLVAVTSAGALDTTWGSSGEFRWDRSGNPADTDADGFYEVIFDPDGKIVAAGWSEDPATSRFDGLVVRLNSDGTLDAGFGSSGVAILPHPGGVNGWYTSVAVESTGRLAVGGYTDSATDGIWITALR